jgi:two-component system chemotaxis response regulator CheY
MAAREYVAEHRGIAARRAAGTALRRSPCEMPATVETPVPMQPAHAPYGLQIPEDGRFYEHAMPTAVIVDDSPLIRVQLRQIFGRIGVTVAGEGASGSQLQALYEQHRPDLVTLDIVMPGKDGVTAAIDLLRAHPAARIVMCTSLTSRDKIVACQRAGVRHYLLKPFDAARAEQIFQLVLQAPAAGGAGTAP